MCQDADCCAQYYARVGATQRPLNRQFDSLAAALDYTRSQHQCRSTASPISTPRCAPATNIGGASVLAEWEVGGGTLTSVTAWRYWDWGPKNDRDFTGLPVTTQSQNPTKQNQYTQEIRYNYAAENYDFVVGIFGFNQRHPHQRHGKPGHGGQPLYAQSRQRRRRAPRAAPPPTTLACNPAVLNNLTAANDILLKNTSAALFGKLNYHVTDALTISPGIRFNYDEKSGYYSSVVTGTASNGTRQLVSFTGPFATDPWIVGAA